MADTPQFATKGWFEAVESFAIKRREEFYILGRLKEGEVQAGWRIDVRFNSSTSMYLEIKEVEDVELGSEGGFYQFAHPEKGRINYEAGCYQLLVVAADIQEIGLYLDLKIGKGVELLEIYTELE